MIYILIIAAVLVGGLMPFQAGINAELTRFVRHPFLAAFTSFFIGTAALGLILAIHGTSVQDFRRLLEAPPRLFIGGALGALFVASSIYFIPRMGATAMIAALVTGQLLMSLVIDHFGLLNLPVLPITTTRIVGVILLFAGIFLVVRKGA